MKFLKITVSGNCSSPKNKIAQTLKELFEKMGFGEVVIDKLKEENNIGFDGFISEEKVKIVVK